MITVEEVANIVISNLIKYTENEESSVKRFIDSPKSSERRFRVVVGKAKNIGKTAQNIIDFVISVLSISAEVITQIGINARSVEK